MFNRVSEWLDVVLETDIPAEVVAFGFNLYEDEHYFWSMELIGASEFDVDDEDWLCNEVTDFGTRENPLRWHRETGWEEILNDSFYALKEYLKKGKYADVLKAKSGVGVGFVSGDIELLYAGGMLIEDYVPFCTSYLPEVQNEMPKAEEPITSPQPPSFVKGKKLQIYGKVIAFIIVIVLIISLFWVVGLMISIHNQPDPEGAPQLTEDFEEASMPLEHEKTESGQIKRQAYIQPGMPEPFIEVLRQYEQFMNADKQDLNDEDVREEIDSADGKWRYLYDELCGSWLSAVRRGEEDVIRYSLEDLTGDGYPELVMGYCLSSDDTICPEVVYYYSQTEGIKMECLSSYYTMELYEDSVIVYVSGGATYTETFIQFKEETESWQQVACIVVDWDYETDSVRGYYWGDDVSGNLTENRPMSVEEYQKIIAQYATEPVEPEWTSLILP